VEFLFEVVIFNLLYFYFMFVHSFSFFSENAVSMLIVSPYLRLLQTVYTEIAKLIFCKMCSIDVVITNVSECNLWNPGAKKISICSYKSTIWISTVW
jgi:hypothetical protein